MVFGKVKCWQMPAKLFHFHAFGGEDSTDDGRTANPPEHCGAPSEHKDVAQLHRRSNTECLERRTMRRPFKLEPLKACKTLQTFVSATLQPEIAYATTTS